MNVTKQVKDAIDLVALISQNVKLQKVGANFKGLCPFHSEKTPSFYVNPQSQYFHCFGCGKTGDVFHWIQERENITFSEALELLAQQSGIELPNRKQKSSQAVAQDESLRNILEQAQLFFQKNLEKDPKAIAYIKKRGFNESQISDFGFGFANDSWDELINHLQSSLYSIEQIHLSGLSSKTEKGKSIDFLRDRITIPIRDPRGRIIAFAGRTMGDSQPKYLNTRETNLFKKSHTLFGMDKARHNAKEGLLIVEGYFDVLQLQKLNILQGVAPMGTALTEDHLKVLKRYTNRLIFCFDGDDAGRKAMHSSLKAALPMEFELRLLELPQDEDPDSWSLKLGSEGFKEALIHAPDWTSFILNRLLTGKDLSRLSERMSVFKLMTEFLPYLPKNTESRSLLASLGHQLQIPVSEMNKAMNTSTIKIKNEPQEVSSKVLPKLRLNDLVKEMLFLFSKGHEKDEIRQIPEAWWIELEGSSYLQQALDLEYGDGKREEKIEQVISTIDAQYSSRGAGEYLPNMDGVKRRLEMAYLDRERLSLQRKIQEPATLINPKMLQQLENEISILIKRKSDLLAKDRRTK
ncbi:MAG: DNA primase [Holophagaceae bacterium]